MRPFHNALLTALVITGLSSCATAEVRPIRAQRSEKLGLLDRLNQADTKSRLQSSDSDESPRRTLADSSRTDDENSDYSDTEGLIDDQPTELDPQQQRHKKMKLASAGWRWPLRSVSVSSYFGSREAGFHEGIDLKAKSGTPVYSVDAGTVVYANRKIKGYGKMIVIRHPSGLSTLYAHNSRLLVRKGQIVKKGQRIAISGQTGRASGPHLHFEVRDGVVALDPMEFLPASTNKNSRMATRRVATRD